jgi:tetratricopeptide (TPR) repeat protein
VSGDRVLSGIAPTDDLPPRVAGYLSAAFAAMGEWREAESLLWRAQAADPTCLHVYYTLYKFYFNRNRLGDAERAACLALDAAARQAHIPSDWRLLDNTSCDWGRVDAPQHFYLFTLKALAFIRLRQQRAEDAQQLLAKLREIDPQDSVGASVIEAYAAGATQQAG